MDYTYLRKQRSIELLSVIDRLPSGGKVLEIGAGAGWQAKMLSERGFLIEAIDIEGSRYIEQQVWPVVTYDGHHIPFPNESFDVVFSSNVLEHVRDLQPLLLEIRRVLKSNGLGVHILPTATWRLWTIVTHYPFVLKSTLQALFPKSSKNSKLDADFPVVSRHSFYSLLLKSIWPHRHGEVGNSLTELYFFSRFRWLKLFRSTDWEVVECYPNKLYYSGNMLLGVTLSFLMRKRLHKLLGSSSMTYIVSSR